MNGDSSVAGFEPTDPGEPRDSRDRVRSAYQDIERAKEALETRGEWRLAREIEDALARWRSEENPPAQFCILCEGECRGEEAHDETTSLAQALRQVRLR